MTQRRGMRKIVECLLCTALLTIATFFLIALAHTPFYELFSTLSTVQALPSIPIQASTDATSSQASHCGTSSTHTPTSMGPGTGLPRLAYAIFGAPGDGLRMRRVLQAVYHPRNQYVLHLDAVASPDEQAQLSDFVASDPTFSKAQNVHLISKANRITYRGPTMVSGVLHGAAVLLKKSRHHWDWFISLSAADYPLVTQDDLLHALSNVSRDLNFIEHMTYVGWKVQKRAMPLIVDPALHLSGKMGIVKISSEHYRKVPTNFRLFTGSAWMVLSQPFMEYLIWGWDNLPRTVLMYYTNIDTSSEGYFQTVICNADEFRNTTVNHDLHYITWDNPPKQHPRTLTVDFFPDLVESGAPFARKFKEDDIVLDKIDELLLGRPKGSFTPGAWCANNNESSTPCSVISDTESLNPGSGSERVRKLLLRLLSEELFRPRQCAI